MTFRENAALSDFFVNDWQWILFANNELDTDHHARRANGHVKRKSLLHSVEKHEIYSHLKKNCVKVSYSVI